MKHIRQLKYIILSAGLLLPLLAAAPAHATGSAQLYLSPAAQSAYKGSAITINIMASSGGSSYYFWKANLTYSTAHVSSISVATASGSKFTQSPVSDVAGSGEIKISRYATSAFDYSGPVATITIQSDGTVGSTDLTFQHICTSSSDQTPCSSVLTSDGTTSTNLLSSTTGGTYSFVEPPASPSTSSSASSTKSTTKKVTAATTATTTPAAPATTTTTTTKKPSKAGAKITLTVRDQNGKPLEGAKVTLGGKTGTTDKNGRVTISGLPAGKATGSVKYDGQTQPLVVDVLSVSDQAEQAKSVTLNAKKTSSVLGLSVGVIVLLAVIIGGWYIINRKRSSDSRPTVKLPESPLPKLRPAIKPAAVLADKPKQFKPVPSLLPAEPRPVAEKTEKPAPPKPAPPKSETRQSRMDPLTPGIIISPEETGDETYKPDK